MALDALILDLDGTLIDTNGYHVAAWERAFADLGYRIPADRIAVEIGKGGDQLVPAILGAEADARDGDALRDAQSRHFRAAARETRFGVFDGVPELFEALARRGLRTALATSSSEEQLDATLRSAGLDLKAMADLLVTNDDADASKPAPDLIVAAVRKLELSPAQCAMVGDTPYDAQACNHAGVACLGVLTGVAGAPELLGAGARAVWRDVGHLLEDLDQALDVASPGAARLTNGILEQLVRSALEAAREGLERGETPIGAVLARADGTVLARGYSALRTTRDHTAHAGMMALRAAAGRIPKGARDLVLATTLEPCVMCTGAAIQTAVDTIVFALEAPPGDGTARVRPARHPGAQVPRIIGGVLADESRALLGEWRRR